MDLTLIFILVTVVIIAFIVYKLSVPQALDVLDKPVEIIPEETKKAPAKKARAKAATKATATKSTTASKTRKNSKLKFLPK